MKLYKVKLLAEHTATAEQVSGEYLKNPLFDIPMLYPRGEAIKKARAFGGKIEVCEENQLVQSIRVAKINRNALVWGIEKVLMNVTPEFVDTDLHKNEKIYTADVFSNIFDEKTMDKKAIEQIGQLINAMVDYDFVIIA